MVSQVFPAKCSKRGLTEFAWVISLFP